MVSASARTTASFPADGQQVITACASRSTIVIENWKRAREARKPPPRIRLSLVAQTLVSGLKAGRAVKRTSKRKRRSKVIPAFGGCRVVTLASEASLASTALFAPCAASDQAGAQARSEKAFPRPGRGCVLRIHGTYTGRTAAASIKDAPKIQI